MSILSSDPIAQACEPFGKYYEVRPSFATGGICPDTLASHINDILILPSAKLKTFKALVNRVLVLEAEDYIKRWHTCECRDDAKIDIIWTKSAYDEKQLCAHVYVNKNKWIAVSIRKRIKELRF